MKRRTTAVLIIAQFAALGGCGDSTEPTDDPARPGNTDASERDSVPAAAITPWFERAPNDGGIVFDHDSGHRERFYLPTSFNGGAALFDADNDGDLDAYLVQSGTLDGSADERPPNQLFLNDGAGAFTDVDGAWGMADRGIGFGVACADYDGDGDVDVLVTNLGPNVLYRNDGEGRFVDVTAEAGLTQDDFSTGAVFFDADGDGDLDLYVANYLQWSVETERECRNAMGAIDYCRPTDYRAPARDRFYRNEGGRFTDASESSGVDKAVGTGLGVVAADFDSDGDLDIFVANDGMKDHFWRNDGRGTFKNDALLAGCAVDGEGAATATMGIVVGDLDGDADPDLIVCNLRSESDTVFRNEGTYFTDITSMWGLGTVSRPFTRFGLGLIDFDHDGHRDLYIANGRVAREATNFGDDPYAEPNLILRGNGSGFEEVTPRGGMREELFAASRAAAFGDVDGDGDVDVLVVNRDDRAHLLMNIAPKAGDAIRLRLLERNGADAVDATVRMNVGDRVIADALRTTYSYLASNEPVIHIGLGDATEATDVVITWPDGEEQRIDRLAAGETTIQREAN